MSAPSFASFPPSFSSFPEQQPGTSTHPSNDSKEPKSSRKNSKKHRKEDRHERDRKGKRSRHSKPEESLQEHYQYAEEDDATRFFISDKRGDSYNIQYGGPEEKDIPKYKCVSRGKFVLGLPSLTVLDRRQRTVELGRRGGHGPTLTDGKSRALLTRAPTRRITAVPENSDKDEEYIALGRRPNEKEQPWAVDQSDAETSASEAEQESESGDDTNVIVRTAQQEALASLEKDLSNNPTSSESWLKLLSISLSSIPIGSRNATTARADITISILSQAISADRRNLASGPLRLRYLRAGELRWEPKKLHQEWENAYLYGGGTQVWMEWLDWKVRTEGIECIVDAARRVLDSLATQEDDEMSQVRVFWRVAGAFRQAGFTERAIAMFQAQAELIFEIPQALYGLPFPTILDNLEEFWESEVPRIGETGSSGWARWVSSGKKEAEPAELPLTPSLSTHPDRFLRWAHTETRIDESTFLPTKSFEQAEGNESDPYSTILFTDIRPMLVNLETPRAKNAFRLCWLSLLGLSIPGLSRSLAPTSEDSSWDDRWCSATLSSPSHLEALFPSNQDHIGPMTDATSGVIVGRERQYAKGPIPVKEWGYGVFDPLDATTESEGMWGRIDVQDVDHALVRRIFCQLRLGDGDWEWDVLSLAFEAAVDIKSALKLSQSYLSIARDSLPHWAAHAQLQRRRDKHNDARKVYTNVLGADPNSSSPSRPWLSRLWWSWTEMEWVAKLPDIAKTIIIRAAGVEGSGSIPVLRAKRTLEDNARAPGIEWKDAEAWWKMRALLELLGSNDVDQALAILDKPSLSGVAAESMITASLLLIYRHSVVLRNPMPPSVLRERASRALERYPSNSVLLELFLEGEKGQSVWGRVRDIYGDADTTGMSDKGVHRRLQEVWISRWQLGQWMAEVERTRKGLAGAVDSDRTRGSATIWRVYIELELRAGKLQRARDLFWRAISECPSVKELYLLAFDQLRQVFTSHELGDLVNTMAERGIRMRTEPDDAEAVEDVDMSDDSGNEGDSEIEENAREIRRLMPY